jgi:putative hydroxymethylpyrimidine transport system substrate-binding protein
MKKASLFAAALMVAAMVSGNAAHANEKLTVMLEWFVNPDHAPLIVASELRLFEKAGLEVELIPPADPSSVPRLISAAQADVGIHYQPNLYLDHQAGLPIVRFGTLVETPLNSLIVLEDGPIKTLSDLKDKTVGFSVSGFEEALLGRMLASAGLTSENINLVNVNFALSASLISGKVDATIGGFRNFELTQMKLEGRKGKSFFPEENGVPIYDELIFITRQDLADDNRLPRFLSAVEQGTIYLTNHPDHAWELFIKAYPALNDALNKQAFIDTLPRFSKRPAASDEARYQRFGQFMKDSGLINEVPNYQDISVSVD